jgi:hypothetical protein
MALYRTAILLAAVFLGPSALRAHEEPPKTVKERMEYERHRKQIAAAGISIETVWRKTDAGERKKQLVTRYDRNGNAVEQSAFAEDSIPTVSVISHYTQEHVIFEQTVIAGTDTEKTQFTFLAPRIVASALDFAPTGYLRSRLTYTYSDTLIIAAKTDSLDNPVYTIFYRYPEGTDHGDLSEARQVDATGRQTTRIRNLYSDGVRIEKQVYDSRDSLDCTFLYTYTASQELETLTRRMVDGTVASERRYRYAPDGTLESIVDHDAAGAVRSTLLYEYDRYDNQ